MLTSAFISMSPFLAFAADVLAKSTVLLVLVALAAHLLRRHSAALRHLLWTLAIAGIVAMPVLTSIVPFRLGVLPATGARSSEHTRLPVSPIAEPTSTNEDVATRVAAGDAGDTSVETARATLGAGAILVMIWLAGALALLARFAFGVAMVTRIARRAVDVTDESWKRLADRAARSLDVRSPIDIRRSDEVAMPFACGLITPVIVLPAVADAWTADRRDAVLMHEFAHISRGDLAMNTLSHFARALYWFHPLAWLAAYRLRVEGERACDDAVLRAGALPSDYAEHLLSIVRTVGNTVPNVALAMARRSDFEGRLLAILEPGVPRGKLTSVRAAGMAALFLIAVMPLAAMAPATAESSLKAISAIQEPEKPGGAPSSSQNAATVSALIETLTDANAAVRMAAVNSLAQLGDPRAIAALAKALREDSDARVREAAAYALGEIDDSRAVAPLLEALKSERAPNVREKIVRALGEIDDPSAVSGIAAVVKDPAVGVRRAAVWALGELEDPSALPSLMSMVRDEDAEVRKQVAEALGQMENTASIAALTTLAKDAHPDVRVNAISALGQLEDHRTLGTLVAALKDDHADVRNHAADAIHQIDGLTSAPPALIEALRDSHSDVRKSAAHSLGSIGDAAAVPGLKRATSDSDTEVRHAAAEALKDIGGPDAIQALMGMLKDPDPEIRRIAAEALGSKRR